MKNNMPLIFSFVLLLCLGFLAVTATESPTPDEAVKPTPLPSSCDLGPLFVEWELTTRNQGARGTCSVFTIVGALEFLDHKHGNESRRLSPEFANWAKNKANSHSQDGGFFSDILKGVVKYGICGEKSFPYKNKFEPELRPDAEVLAKAAEFKKIPMKIKWIKPWNVETGLSESEFLGIKRALADGWPVCSGLRWPKKAVRKDGILVLVPDEDVFDGHSVLFIGYRDDAEIEGGGCFTFKNSNNPGKLEQLSYAYAKQFLNDAVFIPLNATAQEQQPHTK